MKMSVLIPYHPDRSYRDLLWSFIRERYERLMPDLELCLGTDPGTPFSRAKARNAAARKATGDIFLFVDADVVFGTELIERIRASMQQYPWIVPFQNGYKLSKKGTGELLERGLAGFLRINREEFEYNVIVEGAFMNVVSREAFEAVGGFDERFQGWGGEDDTFVMALDTIWGRHYQLDGEVYHLWHPAAEINAANYQANLELYRRYEMATGHPDAMKQLIGGRKEIMG